MQIDYVNRLCKNSGNNKLYLRYSFDRLIFASTYLEIKHKRNIAQLAFTSLKSVKEMRKICSNVPNETPEQLLTKMTCYRMYKRRETVSVY